jgi:ABC-type sulfate transport system permease component
MGEGSVARATGRLAEPSDRLRSLREAVALLVGSGAQLKYARALVELGTAVRVAGAARGGPQTASGELGRALESQG